MGARKHFRCRKSIMRSGLTIIHRSLRFEESMNLKNPPPGPQRSPEIRAIQDALIQFSEEHDGEDMKPDNIGAMIQACRKACPKLTGKMFLLAFQTMNERRHEN